MAKSPDEIVAEIDRRQNEEDKDLIPRIGRTAAGAMRRMVDAATGKGAEDFEPAQRTRGLGYLDETGTELRQTKAPTSAVTSPVGGRGNEVRSLNMGKKAKKDGFDDYKKGGKVSSASKRADGIAQRGKTKGRYL